DAEYSVAGLYVIGLLGAATAIHHVHLTPPKVLWSLALSAALLAIVAAALWRLRRPIITAAGRIKIPARLDANADHLAWLFVFNAIVGSSVVVLVFWIDVVFASWWMRVIASVAVMTQTLTFALMAEGRWRHAFQRAAVALLSVGVVFFGWAFLIPGASGA